MLRELPEKYFVLYNNRDEFDILNEYFKLRLYYVEQRNPKFYGISCCPNRNFSSWVGQYSTISSFINEGYMEVYFEDFERLVLNKKEIMSEVTLKLKTQPKKAKNITVGNEYTGIFVDDEDSQVDSFEEASYFRCVNNNGKEARYSIDLFEEPVEEVVKITMQQLVDNIEVYPDQVVSTVNGVRYVVCGNVGSGNLNVAGVNCSCGIYSVNGISALRENIEINPDLEDSLVDYDEVDLEDTVFAGIVEKVIDNTSAAFLLFSTIAEDNEVCDLMDDISESHGGIYTQPETNPNSRNEIKAWLITKV